MKRTSLTFLLPAVFVLSMLVLLAVYAAFVLTDMRRALVSQAVSGMEAATVRAGKRVEAWVDDTTQTLTSTATSKQARDAISQLSVILRAQGAEAPAFLQRTYVDPNTATGTARDAFDYAGDRSAYGLTHAKVHEHFRALRRAHDFYDVFLFNPEGTLVYTVAKAADLGQNAVTGDLSRTTLGSAFRAAMEGPPGTVHFADFAPYAYSNGDPASFLATAVIDDTGRKTGVVAVQLPADLLADVVNQDGQAEDTYKFTLLGADGYFWSKGGETISTGQIVDATAQITAARRGETGVLQDTVDRSGTAVLAAFRPVQVFDAGWSLLTELPTAEVEAPVRKELVRTLLVLAALGLVALTIGWAIGRWIARPLAALTGVTAQIPTGEACEVGFQSRRDEVGELARGLERFRLDKMAADANRREMLFKGKAFDTTSTAMMIADAEGTLLYVNDALTKLFRDNLAQLRSRYPTMNVDALVGTNISIFHGNHDRVMTMLRDPKNARMAPDVQIGTEVFGLSVNAVDAPDGTRVGYVVVWEDVRELRRVKTVIDAVQAAQAMLEIGLDGKILSMNDVALEVYQYDRPGIIGQHLGLLFKAGKTYAEDVLARALADGHLSEVHHRIARDGSDRFVICNLNVIRDRQGKAQRMIAICTDQTEAIKFRHATEQAIQERAAEQERVVDSLRGALRALADGDLSVRIDTAFPTEYESLRLNCNQAAQSLSETLSRVAVVAQSILGGADSIATAAADLSRRTESQAATLEQTAAALDTLTANVRAATNGTLQAGTKVKSAHGEARNNGAVVQQAIDAMTAIQTSSQQISKIISVIDDIAFQTNLLALNAGVEAARAGDAGRGFAVVAAEVRALAQRSSDAAKEIKTLISTSETQVDSGAGLVSQSGRAVEAIVADVAQISVIVQTISQSAQDQSNSLAEINAGVAVLDKVTQQNAVMVEESTAASALLKQEADDLSALLCAFNLSGNTNRRQRPAHAA